MLGTATDGWFRIGNYAEAGLWTIVAAVLGVFAIKRRHPRRWRCARAAAVFFLFGMSDIAEVQTGAWWRPWWLLVWKTSCALAMIWLLWDHLRRRQTRPQGPRRFAGRGLAVFYESDWADRLCTSEMSYGC